MKTIDNFIHYHNYKALEKYGARGVEPFFWEEKMGTIKGIFPRKGKKYLKLFDGWIFNERVFPVKMKFKWIELKSNQVVVMAQWNGEISKAIMEDKAKFESLVDEGILNRHWHSKHPMYKKSGYIGAFGEEMHVWACKITSGYRSKEALCRLYQKKRTYQELVRDYGRLMYKEQRGLYEPEITQFKAELGEGANFEFHFVNEKDCPTWRVQRELDFVTNYPDTLVFFIKSAIQ